MNPLRPSDLAAAIAALAPAAGSVLMVWLGQAGFLFKTPGGRLLLVDPYLSDEAERTHGLSRVAAAPLRAQDITPDLLLVTHGHVDHLDPPTIRAFAENGHTTLVGPPAVCASARTHHGWAGRCVPLAAGEAATESGVRVAATWARHGELGESESIGLLLGTDGLSLWHVGDTEYDARLHRDHDDPIDVVFVPINGSGGNMSAPEAALLGWQLNAGLVVPMHFGMWSDADYAYQGTEPWATPDPALFTQTLGRLSPATAGHVPTLGAPTWLTRGSRPGEARVVVATVEADGEA